MNDRSTRRPGLRARTLGLIVLAFIVLGIITTRKSRTLGPGQTLQLDDFFFTVEEATSRDEPGLYHVRLRVDNRAKRVPFRFDAQALAFVDIRGEARPIRPTAELGPAGDRRPGGAYVLQAGESRTVDYLFTLPDGHENLRLRIMPGGRLGDLLEWLVFGRKEFQLP